MERATMEKVRLETARLLLRPLEPGDIEAIAAAAGEWEVARYTTSIPHPYSRSNAAAWVDSAARAWADGRAYIFALTARPGEKFLGAIALYNDAPGEAMLGFWLGRAEWGRGLMTEAGEAVLAFAFETLAIDRVLASALPENKASIRVLEKLGMDYLGDDVEFTEPGVRGQGWETQVHALTREAWRR